MRISGQHLPAIVVVIGALSYTLFFSWFTIQRARNFNAGWYDLGIMTQVVWRTGHGHGFGFTNPEAGPGGVHGWDSPRTAIHADYLLALLAPLSWTGFTVESLLIVQAATLAAGAWFVYRMARRLLESAWIGVFLSFVYLAYPPLHFANLFEFHAVTLSITFVLAAADAVISGRHRWWWFWTGLALLTKEQVGITVGLVGAILYWWRRERQRAAWALGVPWAWTLIQLFIVIPLSRPGLPWNFVAGKFYESAGDDAGGLIRRLIDPRVWLERLPTRTHLNSLAQLLGPLGLVPIFGLWPLVAVPELLLYWLSDSPDQQHIVHHYHALVIPILFVGTVFAWRTMRRIGTWPRWQWIRPAWINIIVVGLISLGTFSAVRTASIWPWSPVTRWPLVTWRETLAPKFAEALKLVPPEAPVAMTQNVGPYLAARPVAHLLPNGLSEAEYYVILERKFDPAVRTNQKRLAEREMLESLKQWVSAQPDAFKTVYQYDRVLVIQRLGEPSLPIPDWPDELLGQ